LSVARAILDAMTEYELPASAAAGSRHREGPFWDAVDGKAPLPAAAATLGWELISVSPEDGTIEVAFNACEAFQRRRGGRGYRDGADSCSDAR
jgi:hypothetical protein